MAFGGWRIWIVAIGLILLIMGFALIFTHRSAPVILPLSFAGFTNMMGEASALFRSEMPHSASFLNYQTWSYDDAEIRLKIQDGSVLTNTLILKTTDFQAFPTGSNLTVQIRVAIPTNATAFAVNYRIKMKEGLSINSLELLLPGLKNLSYRSQFVPINDESSRRVSASAGLP